MNLRRNKALLVILSLLLVVTTLSGCLRLKEEYRNDDQESDVQNQSQEIQLPESKYPMEVVDGFGNKVTIKSKPWKIVSLAPSHTEILFKLGLGNRIVGVDEFSDYPEEAKAIERVGGFQTVNVERIIELNPDLVLQYGEGNEDINKSLRNAGIPILSYEPESIDEVIELMTILGEITDTMRIAKMETIVMESKKEYIINTVKDAEKPRVFYEVWGDPLMAAGPNTFLDELITLAGGVNIAADAQEGYAMYDIEKLIEKNPEVYLTAKDNEEKTKESITSREGYAEISAVKNDRIYLLDPNIISRPGPRIIDALEIIAKAIHPELFE